VEWNKKNKNKNNKKLQITILLKIKINKWQSFDAFIILNILYLTMVEKITHDVIYNRHNGMEAQF
jgi:hypothetical protein